MRVIAGKYGGRRLSSFSADHIRPTTDRIKESIFNRLQFRIEGLEVLDLFSGTGSLAIEALSRGAAQVTAVESHPQSVMIIKKNKQLLGIGAELDCVQKDVFRFLKTAHTNYPIILVDPPFTQKIANDVLVALSESSCLGPDTEVFIESSAKESVAENYPHLQRVLHKSYGDKFLSQYIFC